METDADLQSLLKRNDHMNILRYIRIHQLRVPELVIKHGIALLKSDLSGKIYHYNSSSMLTTTLRIPGQYGWDELIRCTILEQICYAAFDCCCNNYCNNNNDHNNNNPKNKKDYYRNIAELCIARIRECTTTTTTFAANILSSSSSQEEEEKKSSSSSSSSSSVRFRMLLGRYYESILMDYVNATQLYEELIKENPCNNIAMKRLYCIAKVQQTKQQQQQLVMGSSSSNSTTRKQQSSSSLSSSTGAVSSNSSSSSSSSDRSIQLLNEYIQQNYSDVSAWYELATIYMNMGDYDRASYCYEEIVLVSPTDDTIHVELAECYATRATITITSPTSSSSTTTSSSSSSSLKQQQHQQQHERFRFTTMSLARKHMSQALELNPNNRRAMFGLIVTSNSCLELLSTSTTTTMSTSSSDDTVAVVIDKDDDNDNNNIEFEKKVAYELLKYGCEQILKIYNNNTNHHQYPFLQVLMKEYITMTTPNTTNLEEEE